LYGVNQLAKRKDKAKDWRWFQASRKKRSEALKNKPHSHRGTPHTQESKRKISMANRGKHKPPWTEEQRRKFLQGMSGPNNPNYGKRFSEETRQKMRAAHARAGNGRRRKGKVPWNKNKPLSRKHRRAISEARKGKPHPHK
jgi:hypothetical protein